MKLEMTVRIDKKTVEIFRCDGDVKSIFRRPYVVDAIARALLSPDGCVTITPIIEQPVQAASPQDGYSREEHMHDGCL